jgi:hypothetical protein
VRCLPGGSQIGNNLHKAKTVRYIPRNTTQPFDSLILTVAP